MAGSIPTTHTTTNSDFIKPFFIVFIARNPRTKGAGVERTFPHNIIRNIYKNNFTNKVNQMEINKALHSEENIESQNNN